MFMNPLKNGMSCRRLHYSNFTLVDINTGFVFFEVQRVKKTCKRLCLIFIVHLLMYERRKMMVNAIKCKIMVFEKRECNVFIQDFRKKLKVEKQESLIGLTT